MKYWIIGLLIALLAGTGTYVLNNQKNTDPPVSSSMDSLETEKTTQTTKSPDESEGTGAQTAGGKYIDYSEEAIAQNAGKNIIVYFHADWCSNCRAIEKTIKKARTLPDDMVILKADYDTETELKKKYGVTQQTTMVQVDGEGNKINLWIANAFDDINAIEENLM